MVFLPQADAIGKGHVLVKIDLSTPLTAAHLASNE
jgi:hypothetical protein